MSRRQLMAQREDLQLVQATRPPEQEHEREQIAHNEIQQRPEHAALPRPGTKSAERSEADTSEAHGRVCEPYAAAKRPPQRRYVVFDGAFECADSGTPYRAGLLRRGERQLFERVVNPALFAWKAFTTCGSNWLPIAPRISSTA